MQAVLANGGWTHVYGLAECSADQLAALSDAIRSIALAAQHGKKHVQISSVHIDLQRASLPGGGGAPFLFFTHPEHPVGPVATFLREHSETLQLPHQPEQRIIATALRYAHRRLHVRACSLTVCALGDELVCWW